MESDEARSVLPPELAKQLGEAAAAFRQFDHGLKLLVSKAAAHWKAFNDHLNEAAAAFSKIDWGEVDRRATQELIELAELGWTVAPWMTLRQVSLLVSMKTHEVDERFVDLYLHDGGLNKTEKALSSSSLLHRWHPLLVQIFDALKRGEHLIAVPALLLILEGFVAQFADREDAKSVCTTNVPGLVKQLRLSETNRWITRRLWISTSAFLAQLYKRAPFSDDRPAFVNRHWILHGRDATEWTIADALRVLNALSTLHWLMEIERSRNTPSR